MIHPRLIIEQMEIQDVTKMEVKNYLLALAPVFCVICVVLAVAPGSEMNMPTPNFVDDNRDWSSEVVTVESV